jgi:hypothetical protein
MAGEDTTIKISGDAQQAVSEVQRLEAQLAALKVQEAEAAASAAAGAAASAQANDEAAKAAKQHADEVEAIKTEYLDVEGVVDGAAKATDKVTESNKKAGKSFLELGQVFNTVLAKLTAIVGVATTFYNIGKSISTFIIGPLQGANEKAAEFLKQFQDIRPKTELESIGEEITRVNTILDRLVAGSTNANVQLRQEFGTLEELQRYKKKLEEGAVAAQQSAEGKRLKEQADQEKAKADKIAEDKKKAAEREVQDTKQRMERVASIEREARMSSMNEYELIEERFRQKSLELEEAYRAAKSEGEREANSKAFAAIVKERAAALEKQKAEDDKREAEEKKKQQDELDRIKERSQKEQQAIRDIAAAQAAFSAGSDATYQSNSLDLLQQIAQGIQSINQRQ